MVQDSAENGRPAIIGYFELVLAVENVSHVAFMLLLYFILYQSSAALSDQFTSSSKSCCQSHNISTLCALAWICVKLGGGSGSVRSSHQTVSDASKYQFTFHF